MFGRSCRPQNYGSYFSYRCYRPNGKVDHYHGFCTTGGDSGRHACHHTHRSGRAAFHCTNRQELALSHRKLVVLAVFGSDYHGGQWSRLYRLQCRARNIIAERYTYPDGTHNIPRPMIGAARRTRLYRELVAKFGNE